MVPKRYNVSFENGLTTSQVNERINDKLNNINTDVSTKTIKQIIKGNVITLFNILNLCLAFAVFLVGSYKNLTFLGVVICNTLISTFQEINSKKIVDKLAIVSASKVTAIRNGHKVSINKEDVVLDDIVYYHTGNQVIADAFIKNGSVEVNESFVTGEEEPVTKNVGDMILSGSFIVSGECYALVEHVGYANYSSKITKEAKYIKKVNSEIMVSLHQVITIVTIAIVPLAAMLFARQLMIPNNTLSFAVVNTVAALITMIPEGLVLLTSTVLAVSVIRLARYNVLVQELFCIETLARVDVICLDKTGTLTEGCMEHVNTIRIGDENELTRGINAIVNNLGDDNLTTRALKKDYVISIKEEVVGKVNFSSARKYSAITFKNSGTYILGAPEFVLLKDVKKIQDELDKYVDNYRVLVIAHTNKIITNKIPSNLEILGLIILQDKIRTEAFDTLKYFKEQGVTIKIISGDNVKTVNTIAKRIGLKDLRYLDMTDVKNNYENLVEKYDVFGRVTPEQKKFLIKGLQKNHHTVAMTGDGVNDVLALKEADCSIAMASGSDVARNVSQLVLLNSNFDSLPKIVLEGRRTINNIERSASLFLIKTIYATILAFLFLFINRPYPFQPIQTSLTNIVTIGIPSFVLALEANRERVKGKFLISILSKALPGALTIVINIVLIMIISSIIKLSNIEVSTLAVIMTGFTGFTLMYHVCKPFNKYRIALYTSMLTLFVIGIIFFKDLFFLSAITISMLLLILGLMVISSVIYNNIDKIVKKKANK